MDIAYVSGGVSAETLNAATTPAVATTGANLVVIFVTVNTVTAPIITDSSMNTWTARSSYTLNSTITIFTFECLNPTTSASHTFTATAAGQYVNMAAHCWSGVKTSNAFYQQKGSITGMPGLLTTLVDKSLIITAITEGNLTTGAAIDSGFTIISNYRGYTYYGSAVAYKIQTTAGDSDPSWTKTGGYFYCSTQLSYDPPSGTDQPFMLRSGGVLGMPSGTGRRSW